MTLTLNRRRFLAASAAASGTALLGPRLAFATPDDPTTGDALVVIFLRGGADGLTLVPPFADPGYVALRPTIRVPAPGEGATLPGRSAAADALPLASEVGRDRFFSAPEMDGYFGLHPALQPLYDTLWANDQLAVIPASGLPPYESTTRSHFDAEMHWERGTANRSYQTGWVGRHLAVTGAGGVRLPSTNMDSRSNLMMRGPVSSLAINDLRSFGIEGFQDRTRAQSALSQLYAGGGDALGSAGNELLSVVADIGMIDTAAPANLPRNGAMYPNSGFARDLQHVALLLRSGLGLKAAAINHGGWDMHDTMGLSDDPTARFTRNASSLAQAMAAFVADLGTDIDEVTIVVISEFGRTVRENGSLGTDHGRGSAMLVAGGGIRGGVYGDFPDEVVSDPQYRDLVVLNDYRLALAEVLQNRMGNPDVGQVFPTMVPGTFYALTRA